MNTRDSRRAVAMLRQLGRKQYQFQAELASQCLEGIRNRERLLIVAPTGTGKTLISQLTIALLGAALESTPRILVVLPSRSLASQHFDDATWMRSRLPIALHRITSETPLYQVTETLRSFGIFFTTPVTLHRRLALPGAKAALQNFDCAIFDEIDVHLTVDEQAERRDTFPALDACMKAGLPILGFSGTGLNRSQVDAWNIRGFRRVQVEIPNEWLPLTSVRFIGISDSHVAAVDNAIRDELRMAFRNLALEISGSPNLQLSMTQVKRYAKSGYQAASRILTLCTKRLQLFESFGCTKGKCVALRDLIRENPTSLILTRFRESAWMIKKYMDAQRLPMEVVHGGMPRSEIESRLKNFRSQGTLHHHSLVLTRELGGRGLDFPEATAVSLFSPRSNHQMVTQELARVRSRRLAPKTAIVLYYQGTAEEEKARRLAVHLQEERYGDSHLFTVDGIPNRPSDFPEPFEIHLLTDEENVIDNMQDDDE